MKNLMFIDKSIFWLMASINVMKHIKGMATDTLDKVLKERFESWLREKNIEPKGFFGLFFKDNSHLASFWQH